MKKNILILSLSVAALGWFAFKPAPGNGYIIKGNLTGLKDKYIYLRHVVNDSAIVDSALVTNETFTFTGSTAQPASAVIYLSDRKRGFQLYIENSVINIKGKVDSLRNVKITGSKSQDDLDAYKASIKDISTQEDSTYSKYLVAQKNKDTITTNALEKVFDSLDNVTNGRTKQFIVTHPKSVVSLDQLQSLAYSLEYPELNKLYSGLDASLKATPKGKRIGENLAIKEKTSDGKPALAFTQNDTSGHPVNLSDFKGKYVLVDFWASWCGPCRAENPNVVIAYNKYKDKNFTVLGVSLDEKGDSWKKAILKDNLTWTEVSDLKYWKNAVAEEYGIQAIPANFLIDPNGIIIGHNLRGSDLENKLAEVLK